MLDRDDFDGFDDEVLDAGYDPHAERGAYQTWFVADALHKRFMTMLLRHAGQEPEQRLWLGVLEVAIADEYVLRGSQLDPEDRRWFEAGACRQFLRSQRCADIACLAGLEPAWFRRVLREYERLREAECPHQR